LLATNYMLRAFCRKETTCCDTYSRIVMLWSISQTRNMFKTHCAKKVHSDDILHGKLHVESTLQGRGDVFRCVAKRNDKSRDVLQRRGHPSDVFAARRQYGHNALWSE